MNVRELLGERLSAGLHACGASHAPALVQASSKPEFGDYQANGVMAAAKKLGQKPQDLATQLIDAVQLDDIVESLTVAGPGFINIKLRADFIAGALQDPGRPISPTTDPKVVVIDYSSPNLAKEMHVGHLRTTIIGDCLARVLEYLGHQVIRQNHVGDWGTQFGMLVTHLEDQFDTGGAALEDLETFYREAKARFDTEPEFATASRLAVVALQGGDARARASWQRFIKLSLEHCQAVYDRLDTSLKPEHVMAESAYNDDLADVIKDLDAKSLLTESDGAQCVFMDDFKAKDGSPLPVIVQKSDGGYLYATTDLAALRHRTAKLAAQRILYLVDARQTLHFKQVFAVARAAEFVPEQTSLEFLPFGTMMGTDGRPFQTRQGGVVKLTELLDEAEQRALDLVMQKNPNLGEDEKQTIAHALGIGAVKYADLSKNRTSDYVFDWDQMLSFDGNTAPYLQYAYTRIQSIFRNAQGRNISLPHTNHVGELADAGERELAMVNMRFGEILQQVAREGFPHYLCLYLYELAVKFSQFYESCPILDTAAPSRDHRLALCVHTASRLALGLELLGIRTVDRM